MKFGCTILYVERVIETVESYEKPFGLKRGSVHENGEYAEMATGDTKLAFASYGMGETNEITVMQIRKADNPPAVEVALISENVNVYIFKDRCRYLPCS